MVKNTESLGELFGLLLLRVSLPGRTPSTPCKTNRRRFHPHDCRRLEVLGPDLAGVVSDREEVLGVEGVPFHSHHLTAVALEHNSDVDSTSLVCASMIDCKHDEYAHSLQ